jgi:hypothetical protein
MEDRFLLANPVKPGCRILLIRQRGKIQVAEIFRLGRLGRFRLLNSGNARKF